MKPSKELIDRLRRYRTLVDKKYLTSLTLREEAEMKRLVVKMNEHDTPFYKYWLEEYDKRQREFRETMKKLLRGER